MDYLKIASPHFFYKNKSMEFFMRLLISTKGMIAHGYGDFWYAHNKLDLYPSNSNHIVGSLAKVI